MNRYEVEYIGGGRNGAFTVHDIIYIYIDHVAFVV